MIEDQEQLRENLADRLRKDGYTVDTAGDGEEGEFMAREVPYAAAVVDLGLPRRSGMELIRNIRADGLSLPILILTARNRWQDKVEGLKAGADDYMVKPFHSEELIARVNALVRRAAGHATRIMRYGPYELDAAAQTVRLEGDQIDLTTFEYRIIECLMLSAGDVISKLRLTDAIYEHDQDRDSNVIEVLVGRLRRKLDPKQTHKPIETLRGRGYRFRFTASA
ncbi:MAG: DNA-binding response regulator [Lysobacteraceae bacterium]|nr:MAG: DNA-binding response regulator [Xanthomonadaceae bacterium]